MDKVNQTKTETDFSPAKKRGIFVTLIFAIFVTAMATTVTGNMIPNFTEYFGISANLAQWLTSGATLVSGIIIPVTAFMIKKMPNKLYFFVSILAYTLGSLFAFLAPTFPLLLISRLIQAVGCGMIMPFGQVILLHIYPAEKHGTVMAAYAMATMASAVVTPTYTGLMLEAVGWRGLFLSLFVLGIIVLVFGGIFFRNIIPKADADLNIGYVVLSAVGFAALLIGLSNISGGSALQFQSGGLMLIGIIAIAAFSWLQLRAKKPMLNLRVFKNVPFTIATITSVCLYLVSLGSTMILPILTKSICGFSDSSYGYATLVGAILSVFVSLYAGGVYDKKGIKPMFILSIILFAVYTVAGFLFTESTGIVYIAIAYALQTVGMSALYSPSTTLALSKLSGTARIDGSAVFNTLRQIASALATTLTVLIYTLAGSDITGVHVVYIFYGIITAVIVVTILFYMKYEKK